MIACTRSGCAGHYSPDGYCDECGHKAVPGPRQPFTRPGSGGLTGGPGSGGLTGPGTGNGRSTTHGRLGAGLVAMPPVPRRDPATAILADPVVPESQRFCASCGEPVGRGRDGKPGRTEGFCPRDRTRFTFVPSLRPGDLLDGRYEILGCLAHGGLGWIYLGRDRNVSDAGADRWVVLKGLINTGDRDAMAAAVAERRFLVGVDHPAIVKIHDFANRPDPATGEQVGYIVMEYVGGRSLKDLALGHRGPTGTREPLPLPEVLAYGLEVLPALGYLHDRGLLYCDFKPDNVIIAGDQLKLIDLGAVRRADDDQSALYGTPGYQAPELATAGPSVGSDIYTVGRTLAVLSFDFAGFSTRFTDRLPDADDVPLFGAEESYHRLLRRATHPRPEARFASAAEMAEQMRGVLREVLAAADGTPRPAQSGNFTGEVRTFGGDGDPVTGPAVVAGLPVPLVDPTDPAAAMLATLGAADPAAIVDLLTRTLDRGLELGLRLVRAHLDTGRPAAAAAELAAVARRSPSDWRTAWYGGLVALHTGDAKVARAYFGDVWDTLPGELAPQLALGAAAEIGGDRAAAARRYERVWRVDHGYPSAAFGLARVLAAEGDPAVAVAVLDEIPDSSSHHVAAQVAAVRLRLRSGAAEADLADASLRLGRLRLDAEHRARLSVEMFRAALGLLGVAPEGTPGIRSARQRLPVQRPGTASVTRVLGRRLTERDIRLGLEAAYRQLAAAQTDTLARYALVDRANAVRPRTMV